jgi:hypothetical protein
VAGTICQAPAVTSPTSTLRRSAVVLMGCRGFTSTCARNGEDVSGVASSILA